MAIVLFLVSGVTPLSSQEAAGAGASSTISGTITSIEITGLKRTRPHAARYPLEKFLGREGATLDLNEVMAAVKDTRILEPHEVELIETEEGLTLHLTVEEKWSIFPVPMVMAGSGDYSFSIFLADTNALGLMDIAAAGGTYGSSGWMGMFMYRHTPNRKGPPGWNTFFMYSRRERKDLDRDERMYRRYTADQLRVSTGLNYPFTGFFSAYTNLSFTDISLKKTDNTFNPPGEGVRLLGFSPGLLFQHSLWDGYLLSQRNANASYSYNLALKGPSYHQMELRFVYEQPMIPGFRVNLRGGASWKSQIRTGTDPGGNPLFEEGPNKAQVDILPRRFSALRYAGISAGLEKYIFKSRWGTLSIFGSWQCVTSYGPIAGLEFDHGPSGGIRFYLSRLALPAMGAGVAHNIISGRMQFAFSMGMEF